MNFQDKEITYADIKKMFDVEDASIRNAIDYLKIVFPSEEITNGYVVAFLLAKHPYYADRRLKKNLTGRTFNALFRAGIKTLEQLRELNRHELEAISNLGEKSFLEIERLLEKEK